VGKGGIARIVDYGAMVHKALEAAEEIEEVGIAAEVIDIRTVWPLDKEAVLQSVEKTSRALVVYESHRAFGIGSEVSAVIAEEGFEMLDAPIMRVAPPNVPVPFSPPLEDAYIPQVEDIVDAVQRLSKW
jgi:pyruvate/2-oxoglutarate/acetoin dehydrogenase E1 component